MTADIKDLGSSPVIMQTYRILVTGSRDWPFPEVIWNELAKSLADVPIDHEVVIVHGACRTGADKIAHEWAVRHGFIVEAHAALWSQHGKSAGPKRNEEMVALGADVCLAFIKDNSRGASHCAKVAESAGIPVRRVDCAS